MPGDDPFVFSDDVKVAGDTRWMKRDEQHACEVYHNTTQTIGNGAFTTVAFNAETFDDWGMHDNSTNNSRITILVPGTYCVYAFIKWSNNSTGTRLMFLLKNGSINIGREDPGYTFDTAQYMMRQYRLQKGDYLEVQVYQNSGGNLSIRDGADDMYFGAFRTA